MSLTQGSGQAARFLKHPTFSDTHQALPRSPPPGSTHDTWSPAAEQASSQGEGRALSSGPPSPLVRSRDNSCPSPHWMGRREASCPPGLPAGRQVPLQTPSPLPQPPEYICTHGLGCRREGPVQPGSGWGMGDLCSDSGAQLGGGLHPVPSGLSSSALPSDRCRRETAVQRPASCAAAALGLAWLSVLGPFSPLRRAGGALSAPDPRSLSRRLPRGPHALS